ncbi:hypothetical protein Ddye_031851 [Dipteronia dyeriana]|uniref:BED-type domain-containing protein n=1 Tax=Dipteronia dyeriana TaxID=168575 RepID=A0AAD9TJ45_9ROSI|nr:hypothetical protein Ddye_031851 [Dipteronia dyeriana]
MASGSGSGSGSVVRDIPPRHSIFGTDPNFEEPSEKDKKHLKSDLFVLHIKKVTKPNGTCWAVCNYCPKEYKWTKSGGYGTYGKHITTSHPAELAKGNAQSQISRFSTPDTQLFKYSDQANREELARMVAVEHLPFSFGEKVGFIKYCHKALNPAACRVPRTTLTRTMYDIYKNEKRILKKYFANYIGRVSVCADTCTDHWRMHSYLGVTCHYMDKAWTIQKRILAFRVFDDAHTADNIYKNMKIIFEEYKIESKIFSIGFDNASDNASNNTSVIPALIELCKPYFNKSIQVQVCVDDWTKAGYRQQEMESEVIYDFFDDDHTTGTGTDDSD